MIGHLVSHYRIIEKLGGGGMGVVYRAEDTRLRRTVALKFLPPELTRDETAKADFVQEAQAASALDHLNICTVHEIDETPDGQIFIVMAYYQGETLKKRIQRGPCVIEDILDIGCQVAEGLAKAHAHGIVHRDIKPANVMVTHEGLAKIVDFGLAKLPDSTGVTRLGSTWGTIGYMAPEQAGGGPVDQRTDLWALGVVLYEMITGRLPFQGDSAQTTIYAILNSSPRPVRELKPDLPLELERIVGRCLTKDPARRYQRADDLLADLRAFKRKRESGRPAAGATARRVPSVAVLPFADMSPQRDQDYFCEGMAEELINALSHLEGVRVASRTSAFQFKGQAQDIRKIGEQLDVQTVLEGSVRKAGNRLRITAELVSIADGYHLWSDRYDRDMDDVFAIQDEITRAIVEKLKVKLVADTGAPLVRRHTENQEAYNLYLKGRYHWNRRTEQGLTQGIRYFEQAIAEDPAYALAYVGLADSFSMLAVYTALAPADAAVRAKAAAARALELDDTLAEAHTSLAIARWQFDWDWAGAEHEFQRAIAQDPGYATAHNWYAAYLGSQGRSDEAIAAAIRARELDPLSPTINPDIGWHHYFKRHYDEAIEDLRRVRAVDPDFAPTHLFLGQAYLQKRMFEEAIAEFETACSLEPSASRLRTALGHAYAVAGRRREAQQILDELIALREGQYIPPDELALVHVGLNETDQALEWLEKAIECRSTEVLFVNVDPRYDPLRADPRFRDLVRRMGLDPGPSP